MEYSVNIYDLQENGRCKADLSITELDFYVNGFIVVPGPQGHGVIVHMPKGMGTDWKYKKIEWAEVRHIVSEEYLKFPGVSEILKSITEKTKPEKLKKTESKPVFSNEKMDRQIFVNYYDFDEQTGDCLASLILPKSRVRIEGFKVKNEKTGGISVFMPHHLGTTWKYQEISWKDVRQIITEEYLKERQYVEKGQEQIVGVEKFYTVFRNTKKTFKHELVLRDVFTENTVRGTLFITGESIKIHFLSEEIPELGVTSEELYQLTREALNNGFITTDHSGKYTLTIEACSGYIVSTMVDFSLPGSEYFWKNFFVRQNENGEIVVSAPPSLKNKWKNKKYPWPILCDMLKHQFCEYVSEEKESDNEQSTAAVEISEPDNSEIEISQEQQVPLEPEQTASNTKKKNTSRFNSLQRVRNAENTTFAFVPQSVLKLEEVGAERKYLTRQIVNALNRSNGGIGPFEIELLEWVSRFKYIVKTMILDLVLSGYISLGEREKITASKMTDIMNRLYKYDLIETSRFISVDDNGEALWAEKRAIYRVHTLGATGYNLLKEMGRHPERRNPFGVLADGNTVKKQLAANQWLVYWLTHFAKGDVVDYSINSVINQIGLQWNGARIYASINMETAAVIAEPVRRCETFERDRYVIEIQEKLTRIIEMLDHEDQLYNAMREQVVYPVRPIISIICEDDEHINEVVQSMKDIIAAFPQQQIWFTSDMRLFNYDCKGERFLTLVQDELEVVNLDEAIGMDEMTMEERGDLKN